MTIATGTRLGRYEIRSKLCQGGMGEVYLAEDTTLRRRVALKLLPLEHTQDVYTTYRFPSTRLCGALPTSGGEPVKILDGVSRW